MKRKLLKVLLYTFIAILVLIGALLGYVKFMLPNVGAAPDITVEITPERVERGAYLANHVALCMDCHAERDFTKFAGPVKPGTHGAGGERFDQTMNFPGVFYSRNLTPYGLSGWTDGEIFRAVTTGVSKDGRPLFPFMPYESYGQMDQEDIYSIIAYLRSLEPVERENKPSKPDFPFSLIMHTIPVEANNQPMPDKSDKVAYGKYLTTFAGCVDCHTKMEKGKFIGEEFAGGFAFTLPNWGTVTSANLTPHETGLGNMSEQEFIRLFKRFQDSSYVNPSVQPGDFQTMMPWMMYSGMTEEDLGAIYAYLRTVKPVENRIVKFVPAE